MCFDERNTDSRGRPRAVRRSDSRTRFLRRSFVILSLDMTAPLLLLAFLAEDKFIGILHALALVGLRRTVAADLGGDLADALDIVAVDDDLGRLRHRDRDAFRDRIDDVVAVAERQLEVLALQRGAIADAGDLELLLETLGDAGDQIGHLRTRGSVKRLGTVGLDPGCYRDHAVLELHFNVVMHDELKLALRAL